MTMDSNEDEYERAWLASRPDMRLTLWVRERLHWNAGTLSVLLVAAAGVLLVWAMAHGGL